MDRFIKSFWTRPMEKRREDLRRDLDQDVLSMKILCDGGRHGFCVWFEQILAPSWKTGLWMLGSD